MAKRGPESKYWCFTSYADKEGFLWWEDYGMVYLVQQEEACPTTGKIHWQGFVVFETKQRLTSVRKRLGQAHWEPMRGTVDEAADYCSDPRKRCDGGLLVECGVRPLYGDAARANSTKERYKAAFDLALLGRLREIEPSMLIRHLGNIQKISTLFGAKPSNIMREEASGVWLVGSAGSGKTTLCQKWPHYSKDPRHRWFDGYCGEDCVVVDDLAPFHVAQTDIFKQLGHQFAFQGETKGGQVWLRPLCVIITSQYMQHQVWEKDDESRQAIARRYKSYTVPEESAAAEAYINSLLAYKRISHDSSEVQESCAQASCV